MTNDRALMVALACALTACGAEVTNNGHSHTNNGHSHSNNGTTADGVDEYVDGLMKPGTLGEFEITLVSAEPAPPDVGDNTWTVRITDIDGAAVEDAVVVVAPFMPEHDHGTTPAEFTGTPAGDGTYVVGPFDLFMPGVWLIDVRVTGAESEDEATFSFRLEG